MSDSNESCFDDYIEEARPSDSSDGDSELVLIQTMMSKVGEQNTPRTPSRNLVEEISQKTSSTWFDKLLLLKDHLNRNNHFSSLISPSSDTYYFVFAGDCVLDRKY